MVSILWKPRNILFCLFFFFLLVAHLLWKTVVDSEDITAFVLACFLCLSCDADLWLKNALVACSSPRKSFLQTTRDWRCPCLLWPPRWERSCHHTNSWEWFSCTKQTHYLGNSGPRATPWTQQLCGWCRGKSPARTRGLMQGKHRVSLFSFFWGKISRLRGSAGCYCGK